METNQVTNVETIKTTRTKGIKKELMFILPRLILMLIAIFIVIIGFNSSASTETIGYGFIASLIAYEAPAISIIGHYGLLPGWICWLSLVPMLAAAAVVSQKFFFLPPREVIAFVLLLITCILIFEGFSYEIRKAFREYNLRYIERIMHEKEKRAKTGRIPSILLRYLLAFILTIPILIVTSLMLWVAFSPSEAFSSVARKWVFRATGEIAQQPSISFDGIIYIGTYEGTYWSKGWLYAVDPGTGKSTWSYQTGRGINASPVLGKDGTVFVGSDEGWFYAFRQDGKVKWRFDAGGWISTAAISEDGTVYFSASNAILLGQGKLYALDSKGRKKWEKGYEGPGTPLVGEGGKIFIGALDGNLYSLKPDGKEAWRFQTKGDIVSTPALDLDGNVIFGSRDGFVYAVSPRGKLVWKVKAQDAVESSPAIAKDGTIYIGSEDAHLYAISRDGRVRWRFEADGPIRTRPAIGKDGTIYVGTSAGTLYALTPKGAKLWELSGEGDVSSPVIGKDGTIYVGTARGFLYALKPK